MSKCGCWFLLLGPDEGDRAVGLQRPGPLPGPAVEHGQRGQRWRDAAASRHVPQLVGVPEDGVVVVQLDPAAGGRTGSRVYTQKCLDRLLRAARCRSWRLKLESVLCLLSSEHLLVCSCVPFLSAKRKERGTMCHIRIDHSG